MTLKGCGSAVSVKIPFEFSLDCQIGSKGQQRGAQLFRTTRHLLLFRAVFLSCDKDAECACVCAAFPSFWPGRDLAPLWKHFSWDASLCAETEKRTGPGTVSVEKGQNGPTVSGGFCWSGCRASLANHCHIFGGTSITTTMWAKEGR